ncbi:HNH endonuclease signature motif containing protein [Mycobacteroides salmoniphilum]|uniref:HNH endonuclease signature motif containing protein n=1 Tax=Mycobacteroides salmoniphilum TaxID=404941 RepID=UPI0010671122|nr:HNH endonuclease signature motif containing protein [Mycobacteroides salmoniphilum]
MFDTRVRLPSPDEADLMMAMQAAEEDEARAAFIDPIERWLADEAARADWESGRESRRRLERDELFRRIDAGEGVCPPDTGVDPVFEPDTDPDALVAGLLDQMRERFRHENRAAAQRVLLALRVLEERMCQSLAEYGEELTGIRLARAEIGLALGLSRSATSTLIICAEQIGRRMSLVEKPFLDGELSYANACVISSVLAAASQETVDAISAEVIGLAKTLPPQRLRSAIWRRWIRHNADEAARAREQASGNRYVRVQPNPDGMAFLTAHLTLLEARTAERRIEDVASTVCRHDPRTRGQRMADAFMSLLAGGHHIACQCGMSDCPYLGIKAPPQHLHLAQVVVDLETLLGLANNPARLGDGSVIDPELARKITENAHWQAIFTELRKMVPTVLGRSTVKRTPLPAPVVDAPPRKAAPPEPGPAIPAHPDGHGGYGDPPAGALTYRPGAALADAVRTTFSTCTFPGCSMSSSRCELDHIVEFNHDAPICGGWTIFENLHPVCHDHHDLKTRRRLRANRMTNGAIRWAARTGDCGVTQPELGLVPVGPQIVDELPLARITGYSCPDDLTVTEGEALYFEETWWEMHYGNETGPSQREVDRTLDPEVRAELQSLADHYHDHLMITARRRQASPRWARAA